MLSGFPIFTLIIPAAWVRCLFGSKWAPFDSRIERKPLKNYRSELGLKTGFRRVDEAYGYELLEQPYPVKIIVEVEPLESISKLSEDIEGRFF